MLKMHYTAFTNKMINNFLDILTSSKNREYINIHLVAVFMRFLAETKYFAINQNVIHRNQQQYSLMKLSSERKLWVLCF